MDSIMGVEIESHMRYELGKTLYSIESLRDWFLIRRMFVDPMTNLVIKNGDLEDLIKKMKEKDYFPDVNVRHMSLYRVFCIFEKYNNLRVLVNKQRESLGVLSNKIDIKKEKMAKSMKRKNGENAVNNYQKQIDRLKLKVNKINEKKDILEKRFWDDVKLLISSRKNKEEIV